MPSFWYRIMPWLHLSAFLLFVLAVMLTAPTITVRPSALMAGGGVLVTCRIPLHESNRSVVIGIENYQESERPIQGDQGPVTTQLTFTRIPCEAGNAFCTVKGTGPSRTVTAPLTIGGCDPH